MPWFTIRRKHVACLRAKRHPDTNLAGPLLHGVSDRTINSDGGEQQRYARENSEQDHHQFCLAERLPHDLFDRLR